MIPVVISVMRPVELSFIVLYCIVLCHSHVFIFTGLLFCWEQADMDSSGGFNVATGPPPEQDIPLQIPK
jgi:hypothetical protein